MKDKMLEELKRKYSAHDDQIFVLEVCTTDDIFAHKKTANHLK